MDPEKKEQMLCSLLTEAVQHLRTIAQVFTELTVPSEQTIVNGTVTTKIKGRALSVSRD